MGGAMAQEYSDIRKIPNIDVQTVVEVLKARSTSNFSERGFVSSRRDGGYYAAARLVFGFHAGPAI
jgi:hypothetical protein